MAKNTAKHPDYLQRILTAKVYDVAHETPLEFAPLLSRKLHNKVQHKASAVHFARYKIVPQPAGGLASNGICLRQLFVNRSIGRY